MKAECVICDGPRVKIQCSCKKLYCDGCFRSHIERKPDHKGSAFPTGPGPLQRAWNYVRGFSSVSAAVDFEKDEGAKWFGLVEETSFTPPVCRIVETTRFAEIMESSKAKAPASERRQFPSLVSFTGITGAGKSSLIRALIHESTPKEEDLANIDAPIVGQGHSLSSTTGEVNLYYDPKTFGTSAPRLYVDCEGLDGTTPIAVTHQKRWIDSTRGYRVQTHRGGEFDRKWAVGELYPRFVYLFSDVICYVERNPRGFAKVTERLLEWASVAAQKAINQYALPAVILILNGPANTGKGSWIFGEPDTLTHEFFSVVESQIKEGDCIRRLAKKYGVETVGGIFNRCFSSVHVMFVPCKGHYSDETGELLGSDDNIWLQYRKLLKRIEIDTARVQAAREEAWMRFDSKQFSLAFHYAFKHLTTETNKPFDFSDCRSQTDLPTTAQDHVTEFLKTGLSGRVTTNFDYAASVLGSCAVLWALRENGHDLFSYPDTILNPSVLKMLHSAIKGYLDSGLRCAYVVPNTNVGCVNTKDGHAKGHQGQDGRLLEPGEYIAGTFDATDFMNKMRSRVSFFLNELNACEDSQKHGLAKRLHRECIQKENPFLKFHLSKICTEKTCFGCLIKASKYRLPCGHHLCDYCISFFDQTPEDHTDHARVSHKECFLCCAHDPSHWPFEVSVRPPLSGIRVLSLDGGGVRAVITLQILKRLQNAIGLSLRPCEYFDLIVGTSAGGMLALGLGEHKWTVDQCMKKYEYIINHGFEAKTGTKWWGIGWAARLFRRSIYLSKTLEHALMNAYGNKRTLFGLDQHQDEDSESSISLPRVAITTTVEKELKLFTNYQLGGPTGDYLPSNICTWEVARSTSAAPMFFEPFKNAGAGVICLDGGLIKNNPIATAHLEAKKIWGDHITFDTILSVGTGKSKYPPDRPNSTWIVPDWLNTLFEHFMTSFNGQAAWKDFTSTVDVRTRDRCKRLNMNFKQDIEPALDAVSQVSAMRLESENYKFERINAPTCVEPVPSDEIKEVATQIRACLFYFHPRSIQRNGNNSVAVVHGIIFCRIQETSRAFCELHAVTKEFELPESRVQMPLLQSCRPKFALPVYFQHDIKSGSQLVEIRVRFTDGFSAPITGFPVAYEEIESLVVNIPGKAM